MSSDPAELESAAIELSSSDDPNALDALAAYLGSAEFLDRLDPPEDDRGRIAHLSAVLEPFSTSPSPEVESVCLRLVDNPIYLENDRKMILLNTMAAVVPMSADSVAAFRRANEEDYFAFNALLLAQNGSAAALQLFVSMMKDKEFNVDGRVELVHKAILPRRTSLPILKMVGQLMAEELEEPVANAAIESVFDYQRTWFSLHGPMPPLWRIASLEALHYVLELGKQAKGRRGLPPALAMAVDETSEVVRLLINRRTG
jgi:hypothetical protein